MKRPDILFVIIMIVLVGIITINVAQLNSIRNPVELNVARNTCIADEIVDFKLAGAPPEQQDELRDLCAKLIKGKSLDLVKRNGR